MKKIAIQGIAGSFHHEAAEQFFDQNISLVECNSFREVFNAVKAKLADYGIVAVENSLHGSINAVYRLLATENLWVCGEVRLKIEQYLIAANRVEETDFSIIDKVYSQAPALAQCENWLNAHMSGDLVETRDTAESVRHIMHNKEESIAAVAGKKAADLYGGTIIAGPINDDEYNYTRFFVISHSRNVKADANRTSIIITEKSLDKPGTLYDALGFFKKNGISLSKLDSHPLPGRQRRYSFYIDFDKHLKDSASEQTLSSLKKEGWDVTILGSYAQSTN